MLVKRKLINRPLFPQSISTGPAPSARMVSGLLTGMPEAEHSVVYCYDKNKMRNSACGTRDHPPTLYPVLTRTVTAVALCCAIFTPARIVLHGRALEPQSPPSSPLRPSTCTQSCTVAAAEQHATARRNSAISCGNDYLSQAPPVMPSRGTAWAQAEARQS